MPLVPYTFDQLITFTRTSSATFVGSNGLVQNTPISTNLLLQTQDFDNASWAKANVGSPTPGPTITANAFAAPDGTLTADLVDFTLSIGMFVRQTVSFVAGATGAVSVWVYAPVVGGAPSIRITTNNTAAWNTGLSQTYALTAGWNRIALTGALITSGTSCNVIIGGAKVDGTADTAVVGKVFIWGAQLETGSTATTYTRNNGGLYPPRFDYDPVTLAPKGLLVEEQRTNLVLYSEQFDNAYWTKGNVTVTSDNIAAPDGTTTADLFTENASNAFHAVTRSFTLAGTLTLSCYMKAGTRNFAALRTYDGTNGDRYAVFNLSTGVVGVTSGGTTATISDAGNGWYRCSMTYTFTSASGSVGITVQNANSYVSYTGDGTSGIYAWGAQLEAGAFATSYIPTVASQVTRTADNPAIVAPMFAPWYNQSEGTFVVGYDYGSAASDVAANNRYAIAATDGSVSNRHAIYNQSTVASSGLTTSGGVTQAAPGSGTTIAANTPLKVAYAYAVNNFAFVLNGGTAATDVSGALPVGLTQMQIGAALLNAAFLNGHIRSIVYYPTRLSNAQLQALTA